MTTAYRWSVALALLMAAQSLGGLFVSTQYRDADWIRAAWYANDWVTLLVAMPLLLVATGSAASGSARGALIWLGSVAYAIYNYAYYLFGAALNASFPLYVAALVIAIVILILALPQLPAAAIAESVSSTAAARVVGGYFVVTGAGLAAAWLGMWAAHIFAGRATPVPTEAFKLVAALDLSLMVPPLTVGGVLLWRRRPWGYVIAAIAGIQASLYLLVLSAGSLVAVTRGLAPAPGEVPVWGTLFLVTMGITLLMLSKVRNGSAHRRDSAQIPT